MADDEVLEAQVRRIRRRLGCVNVGCVSLLIAVAIILWIGVFSHDWNLSRLNRQFSRLSHPSATKLVSARREVGLLIGNSNHIDYCVAQLRSYSGSRERVRRFYECRKIWNPVAGERWPVRIVFVDEFNRDGYADIEMPYPVHDIMRSLPKNKSLRRHLYIIFVLDAGYDCGLDVRGC